MYFRESSHARISVPPFLRRTESISRRNGNALMGMGRLNIFTPITNQHKTFRPQP